MMVAAVATEDDARELALSLPATIEKPSYGMPGFRVKDRLFARAEPEKFFYLTPRLIHGRLAQPPTDPGHRA